MLTSSYASLPSQSVDEDDLQEEEGEPMDEIDPLLDDLTPDDKLSSLEKLDKYFQSEDMGERYVYVESHS